MLNIVWVTLLCAGVLTGFLKGNVAQVTSAILGSTQSAVDTLLKLAGAICFWSGLMQIAEESGLSSLLAGAVKPIMRPLFPCLKPGTKAYEYTALNISANLLGVGSAATPLGIKAMLEMAKSDGVSEASDNMCTLVAFNTAGPSLIPSSVVALRASLGSTRPDVIVGPAFLAALCAVAAALIADRIMGRSRRLCS